MGRVASSSTWAKQNLVETRTRKKEKRGFIRLTLLRRRSDFDVVFGEKGAVGTGGADFENAASERVKVKRIFPAIDQLAAFVDGRMISGNPGSAHGIVTGEDAGDFAIVAHGETAGLIFCDEKKLPNQAIDDF